MATKSKLTVLTEIFTILSSFIVIGTFFWGIFTGVFESVSISTNEVLDVKRDYARGFDFLINGKIDEAEKRFQNVYERYPTYKSAEEILNLFQEARKSVNKSEEMKIYILKAIIERELVVPSRQLYNKIIGTIGKE